MVWILALHIMAMVCWCASLLYLLTLIAAACPSRVVPSDLPVVYQHHDSLARFVFTSISTPAALMAIITGAIVFLLNRTVDPWLIVKLTLITGLVVGHALTGALVLQLESARPVRRRSAFMAVVLCLLMFLIIWIVLAKPGPGAGL